MIRPSSARPGPGRCRGAAGRRLQHRAPLGPALTDPKEIVTAALKSTEAAKSVHLDVTVDGKATVKLPEHTSGPGTTVELAGTTAAADIDFAKPAARATFSAKVAGLTVAGELIAIDGKTYSEDDADRPALPGIGRGRRRRSIRATSVDRRRPRRRAAQGCGTLVKGEDVASGGSGQCYTVSTTLSPDELGLSGAGAGAVATLPISPGPRSRSPSPSRRPCPRSPQRAWPGATTIPWERRHWRSPPRRNGTSRSRAVTAPPADQVKPAS